jgi:hypothetical protein
VHEHSKENRNHLRSRGEELFILVDQWLNAIGSNYRGLTIVMQGKLTYNEHLDIIIKNGVPEKFNGGRLEMLIHAYFPSLSGEFDAVKNARTELNSIAGAHKRAYQSGDVDGQRFIDSYLRAQRATEAAGYSLKEKLLEKLRSL